MLSVPDEKDIPGLIRLWRVCFGDDEEYIKLFFGAAFSVCKPLVYRENGETAAALYRLACVITVGGREFHGRYVYAAATLPEYRRRGIMGQLLDEANRQAARDDDFIALVPATDELYGYYASYGYVTAMRKSVAFSDYSGEPVRGSVRQLSRDEAFLLRHRKLSRITSLQWNRDIFGYALDCAGYSGGEAVAVNDGFAVCISDNGRLIVQELLSDSPDSDAQALMQHYGCKSCEVSLPYKTGRDKPFGMINSFSPELGRVVSDGSIYMNLALD